MKKYLIEFIGTFFLVFTAEMTLLNGTDKLAPFAIGAILMVMTYTAWSISASNFNPAISLANWLSGRLAKTELAPYLAAQAVGAVLGSLVAGFLLSTMQATLPAPRLLDVIPALVAEFIGTAALVFVYLQLSHQKASPAYFGLAMGATMLAFIYAVNNLSGGIFNPAMAIGACIIETAAWGHLWLYLLGQLGGALAATFVYKFLTEDNLF